MTTWTVARQAPLSTGFYRQEYWSGLPGPPPEDLPEPGIASEFPAALTLAGRFFTAEPPGKSLIMAPWTNIGVFDYFIIVVMR